MGVECTLLKIARKFFILPPAVTSSSDGAVRHHRKNPPRPGSVNNAGHGWIVAFQSLAA